MKKTTGRGWESSRGGILEERDNNRAELRGAKKKKVKKQDKRKSAWGGNGTGKNKKQWES